MDFDFTTETITPDNTGVLTIGGTQGVELPVGTTGQRPSTGLIAGTLRFNTSLVSLEVYNGAGWIQPGTVASVGLAAPSIFTVTGSPVTGSGTLTLALATQAKNTHFVGPASGANAAPTFRTIALSTNDVSDVVITSPSNGQVLSYNSTSSTWVNTGQAAASYSALVSSWTLVSGTKYSAIVTHSLGTQNVIVQCFNATTNALVQMDSIVVTDANNITLFVNGGTPSFALRVVIIANGMSIAAGGSTPSSIIVQNQGVNLSGTFTTVNLAAGLTATAAGSTATITPSATQNGVNAQTNGVAVAGGPFTTINFAGSTLSTSASGAVLTVTDTAQAIIRSMTYFATSFDSPNNSDWVVNALAPTVTDPSYSSMNVRQFSNTTEQGVGFFLSVPAGATNITFQYRGRTATAPGAAATLQMRAYVRAITNNGAVGAWSAANNIASVTVPTNAYFQYYSSTVTLASLGLTAGNLYLIEFTRNVGVAGNLGFNWLLAELTVSFT